MLGWATDVDLVVIDLNLEAGREEGVEANNEVWMPFEQVGYPADYSRCVDAMYRWVDGERGRERGGRGTRERGEEGRGEEGRGEEGRGKGERGGREREEEGREGNRE